MTCHRLRPAFALGVEAQEQSIMMAARSVAELPGHRCEIALRHADFRELAMAGERFDLITGSPPYFPIDAGVLPSDPQRRACRFEERGGVEAYMEAAARVLSEHGRFYLVFQTRWTERVTAAAGGARLHVSGRADFWSRADRAEPFLSVFELARKTVEVPHRFQCAVRDADGAISPAYQDLRMELGVADRVSRD
jgi:tRNA1(Val) A37 N6-methylase TrmN6